MKPDRQNILWPDKITTDDKKFCRNIYSSFRLFLNSIVGEHYIPIAIACSGGIDSTVMAHAFSITSKTFISNIPIKKCLIYVNHQLRSKEETDTDISFISNLGLELGFDVKILTVNIDKKNSNIQALARDARYNVLSDVIAVDYGGIGLLAHNANDNVETKLFKFLKGYEVKDLKDLEWGGVVFKRPMLKLTRKDIERYAAIWNLSWSEDASNSTNKYTRNRIRHDLIPWIEQNVNPGIVNMLADL